MFPSLSFRCWLFSFPRNTAEVKIFYVVIVVVLYVVVIIVVLVVVLIVVVAHLQK